MVIDSDTIGLFLIQGSNVPKLRHDMPGLVIPFNDKEFGILMPMLRPIIICPEHRIDKDQGQDHDGTDDIDGPIADEDETQESEDTQ